MQAASHGPLDGGAPRGLPSPFDESVATALAAMVTSAPAEGVPPGSSRTVADLCKDARAAPRWIPKSEAGCCMLCQKDFSKLRVPRHHCRRCGWAVCGSCSTHVLKLDRWLDSEKPHAVWHTASTVLLRVCDSCHAHSLEGRADAAARTSAGVGSDDWRLRRAFEVIDLDNSGCISWVELSIALRGGVEPSADGQDETHGGFTNTELDDIMKRARAASGTERLYLSDFLTLCEEEPAMRVIFSNAASVADAARDPWAGKLVHDCVEMPAVRKCLATSEDEPDVFVSKAPVWIREDTSVKLEQQPFAEGAMRQCFRCLLQLPSGEWRRMVAKQYKHLAEADSEEEDVSQSIARLQEDVRMQTGAKEWAQRYNARSPAGAKRVDFLQSFLLEVKVATGIGRSTKKAFYLEAFVQGQYVKHSSNAGFVGSKIESSDGEGGELGYLRWTPQAFSHFTFEASGGQQLVVDIQGVGDLYTDPAVHSADHQGFGSGNVGPEGMLSFFLTHQCTPLCRSFGLQPFWLYDAEKTSENSVTVAAPTETTGGGHEGSRTAGRAETLGVEALARHGSCGEGSGCSADGCCSQQTHQGAAAALGQLHTKLALHYLHAHMQGQTHAEAECASDDALNRAIVRLSESDKLIEASAFHAATAAAYLRRQVSSSRSYDDTPSATAAALSQRRQQIQTHKQRWLESQMGSAARDAQGSMDHFDALLSDYTKTDEICALREKWAAHVSLLSESSQNLVATLSGASPTFLKLVAQHEVHVHEVRSQVGAVYAEHRREKLGDVEQLLQEWRGSEQLLLQEIRRKYCDVEAENKPEPEPEPEAVPEPEPEVGLLIAEPESWLELCTASDIGAALLLWSGEEAMMLPESLEHLKYPTLGSLAAIEHLLGHCSAGGADIAGDPRHSRPTLHQLVQHAKVAIERGGGDVVSDYE